QHIVPDGYFICHEFLPNPLIIAFIMTTYKNEVIFIRQFFSFLLIIYSALWAHQHNPWCCLRVFCYILHCIKNRLWVENRTRSTPIWVIINLFMFVCSVISKIDESIGIESAFIRFLQNGTMEHSFHHFRE